MDKIKEKSPEEFLKDRYKKMFAINLPAIGGHSLISLLSDYRNDVLSSLSEEKQEPDGWVVWETENSGYLEKSKAQAEYRAEVGQFDKAEPVYLYPPKKQESTGDEREIAIEILHRMGVLHEIKGVSFYTRESILGAIKEALRISPPKKQVSDEEIELRANSIWNGYQRAKKSGFKVGAKWMRSLLENKEGGV